LRVHGVENEGWSQGLSCFVDYLKRRQKELFSE
jgi:hypothetical protein